jgi:hypothetical protein
MRNFKRLSDEIRHILATEWDPIGIHDVAATKDEYERYVGILMKMLLANESPEALRERLLQIERKEMGLPGNSGRALSAAQKLKEISTI